MAINLTYRSINCPALLPCQIVVIALERGVRCLSRLAVAEINLEIIVIVCDFVSLDMTMNSALVLTVRTTVVVSVVILLAS